MPKSSRPLSVFSLSVECCGQTMHHFALAISIASSAFAPSGSPSWRLCSPQVIRTAITAPMMQAENDELAKQFAEELANRRRQDDDQGSSSDDAAPPPPTEEPFTGIREVILNSEGQPVSIPRRPAPPPARTQRDETMDLVRSPGFIFGTLISLASFGLFLVIAAADSAASA